MQFHHITDKGVVLPIKQTIHHRMLRFFFNDENVFMNFCKFFRFVCFRNDDSIQCKKDSYHLF